MNVYTRYYRSILKSGRKATPRGLEVRFLQNVTYDYTPGYFPRRPHDNPAIGLMEGLQFIAGIFDHAAIARVAPRAQLQLFTGQSAYGPRVKDQMMSRVIQELDEDLDSRRAVVMVNHPQDKPADEPCTISMQFQGIQPGLINSTAFMRSSDAIWGLPYDIIQFGMITRAVARALNMGAVQSAIMIGNAHVYESTKLPSKTTFRTWRFDYPFSGSWDDQRKQCKEAVKSIQSAQDIFELFQIREVSA